ncbi:MAG: hypothetical protein MUC90_00400 [Thermoplasmata archaeon]|nr:hypothetical protein [Thermoplasmata archaeon]
MPEAGQLSVNDRVLLHLSRFATDVPPEEYSPDVTQAGIAFGVGMSRTHVPRAVKGLIKDGLVEELTARVKGHERRMNIYSVTTEGLRSAEDLWKRIRETTFPIQKEGASSKMAGKDIEELLGRKRAIAAVSRIRDGVVEVGETRRAPIRDFGDAPKLDHFYGREAELKVMDHFMETESRVLVVLGNRGYGATALTRKFLETQDEDDCLWTTLSPGTTAKHLEDALVSFGKGVSRNVSSLAEVLALDNCVLAFDDYYDVGEEVVEFFSDLVEAEGQAKIVISARQETPAYNWFYQKEQVDRGVVTELRIKGLDEESAKKMLGNEKIEKDALRRILMFTRGQPLVLKMLREGDSKALKKNTVFTAEEIGYLLFLKDKV